eukprot:TRINITY_DN20136_c0_g2_i5.p1 TRINITY_DN20136_c0_g2~~TRINITY_DN20136_c0_g2_i5.p1  ORF type:complete len:101 (-),score=7.46 TRINITY_DN20136_c0_g2_i5:314-616(-)
MALMKAINMVFSDATNFLCIWHIGRNVLVRYKKLFETKEKWDKFHICWNMLVSSSTEEEYIQHLSMINNTFSTYPEALQYVKCSWLDTYKEIFVPAWTDR